MNQLNASSLIRAGRAVSEPFLLSIEQSDGQSGSVTFKKILRLLPRKRIVAVAEMNGSEYLVKLFIGRLAGRNRNREVTGVHAIEDTGVLTPTLEWQASLEGGGGYLLGFEYIDGADNLIDVWRQSVDDQARLALIGKVIPVLASLHEGGVVQNDIHPENFLIRDGSIYTIDGGDVTAHRGAGLSERKSLDNFALFCAQFHAVHDALVPELLESYRLARGWSADTSRHNTLMALIARKRAARKKNYIDKAFRECTRFHCEHRFDRFLVHERKYGSEALSSLLDNLDERMENGKLLKSGNTATVALVEAGGRKLVVKRYNIKGTGHWVGRMFRKSRAWVSWANALRLEFLGINTVTPVALVEERFGPLRRKAYFVSEYIDGPDASRIRETINPDKEISAVAKLVRELTAAGVSHGDLKASNFLLAGEGAVIIDLDSMKEHHSEAARQKAQAKDRERFLRNWDPVLEQRFTELLG